MNKSEKIKKIDEMDFQSLRSFVLESRDIGDFEKLELQAYAFQRCMENYLERGVAAAKIQLIKSINKSLS